MELGDVTLVQFAMVAATSFLAGFLGGVAGYGSGALTLVVLVPLLGAQAAVPVMSLAALLNNFARLWVYRRECDRKKAAIIAVFAVPTTAIGAWGFTLLSGRGALIVIGAVLILLVPLRRYVTRLNWHMNNQQLAVAAVGYGIVTGGTSGAGVWLLSMLMWAGLAGPAVIATDAAVTLVLVSVKSLTFHAFGALPYSHMAMSLLIGLAGVPGTFAARTVASRLSLKQHAAILDGVVILAGLTMISQAIAGDPPARA